MRRGRDLSSEERAHLEQMGGRIPANFILDDTAVLSLDHVRRRLMSLSRRGRIGLAVIDYLQIMDLPRFHGMNQTQAIGDVTSGLKQLAKQLACPILLLSQLSRKVEERDNKRPMLSDLRDSGSIEQDASSVLFTYRDAYYLEREGPRKGESVQDHELRLHECMRTMEVICAKSREGPIGTTRQTYIAECDVILNEGRF
ncbi:DnaB-like helicase C-terminal domain-containing protein [Brevundimonas diminuta]|uniref:DnaB-like helicase C-terminal domain-containing protein n=1 Tax=Brevundimonas diminuta TaxID=293 RepID=UPI003F815E80